MILWYKWPKVRIGAFIQNKHTRHHNWCKIWTFRELKIETHLTPFPIIMEPKTLNYINAYV
jgi:hypothetical protein